MPQTRRPILRLPVWISGRASDFDGDGCQAGMGRPQPNGRQPSPDDQKCGFCHRCCCLVVEAAVSSQFLLASFHFPHQGPRPLINGLPAGCRPAGHLARTVWRTRTETTTASRTKWIGQRSELTARTQDPVRVCLFFGYLFVVGSKGTPKG